MSYKQKRHQKTLKYKRFKRQQLKEILFIICLICLPVGLIGNASKADDFHIENQTAMARYNHIVQVDKKVDHPVGVTVMVATTTELSVRDYIKQEVENARLDWKLIDCTIKNESNYREMAYYVNKNGSSVDRGIWMWNDKWNKQVTNECAFDYRCSTMEAIKKIKHDGNMNAWYGSKKCL